MAPGSLATARLAHQASQQGWLGGPGHMGGSLRGRGFAPTPNPEPPRSGGSRLSSIGVRCDGFVFLLLLIYIKLYIFNQYTPGKCPMGCDRLTRPRGSGGVGDRV